MRLRQNLWLNHGKKKHRAEWLRLRDRDSPLLKKNRKKWNLSSQRSPAPVTWDLLTTDKSEQQIQRKLLRLIHRQWVVRWWKIRFTAKLKIPQKPKNNPMRRYSVRNKCTATESSTILRQSNLFHNNSQQNLSEKRIILKISTSLKSWSKKLQVRARWW